MDDRRRLANVDTAEKLSLEYIQSLYVQSQWKKDVPVEYSEVYQENCLDEKYYCFKGAYTSHLYMPVSIYRRKEMKMER